MTAKETQNQTVHRLINAERRRKGLHNVEWSREMYILAKDQADKMAKAGCLFHSNRFALEGGECCCGGKGYHSPESIVRSWIKSDKHRAWLLDDRVATGAVAISKSKKECMWLGLLAMNLGHLLERKSTGMNITKTFLRG